MTLSIYERLSAVYDEGWGHFAGKYTELVIGLLKKTGVEKARILDVACGTGSLARELAGYGHQVIGVDLSSQMIDKAREHAALMPGVAFEVQDMRSLDFPQTFHLALCTFDAFNYLLNPEEVDACLRGVSQALMDGGHFVFDANTHHFYAEFHKNEFHHELGGQTIIHRCSYDLSSRQATTVFEFEDGATERHIQRAWDLDELEPRLESAGFAIESTYRNFSLDRFDREGERLICVTRRTECTE